MSTITTPTTGRGAWPYKGTGGTLDDPGAAPGRYYRTATASSLMPGLKASLAMQTGRAVDLNDYAVWRGVIAIQRLCGGLDVDGELGPKTGAAIAAWQKKHGLDADGVFGPISGKTAWRPLVKGAALQRNVPPILEYVTAVIGTVNWESGWDAGAVGVSTPVDLGLGQINGPSHPWLSYDQRFDPWFAAGWVAEQVHNNVIAMKNNVHDAVAAYNLGQTGAKTWVSLGRPRYYGTTDVWRYIDAVMAGGV